MLPQTLADPQAFISRSHTCWEVTPWGRLRQRSWLLSSLRKHTGARQKWHLLFMESAAGEGRGCRGRRGSGEEPMTCAPLVKSGVPEGVQGCLQCLGFCLLRSPRGICILPNKTQSLPAQNHWASPFLYDEYIHKACGPEERRVGLGEGTCVVRLLGIPFVTSG